MTTPANNEIEGLPVAQGLWVPEEGPVAATAMSFPAETFEDEPGTSNNKKHDPFGKTTGEGYSLTANDGSNQTYWGRFNDQEAEVLPTYHDDGGAIPTATARPDDRRIRIDFIAKVYTILSAQMLVTFGMCAFMALTPSVRYFCLETSGGTVLLYTNMVLMFVLICFLHAYKRTYPHNYILLSLFTASMSYMVGFITAAYEKAGAGDLVMEAVFITATVFIILTLFTLQSKYDFSFMGAGLGMCLWIMILWGFISMIFGLQTGFVYALFGTILFSLYIIYDTYMICERLDPTEYIVAAIELYLDIINLFLYILRLLSESRR